MATEDVVSRWRANALADISARNTMEVAAPSGCILALSVNGFFVLSDAGADKGCIVAVDTVSRTHRRMPGYSHTATIMNAVSATNAAGDEWLALLHTDGWLLCVSHNHLYEPLRLDIDADALHNADLQVHLANLVPAANTEKPEVVVIAGDTVDWCRFGWRSTATEPPTTAPSVVRRLSVGMGAVVTFVGPRLFVLDPVANTVAIAVDGVFVSTTPLPTVPAVAAWKLAYHFCAKTVPYMYGGELSVIAIVTECAVLLFRVRDNTDLLHFCTMQIVDPVDIQFVPAAGLVIATMLGELLQLPFLATGLSSIEVVDRIPAAMLHMYTNYAAGSLMRCVGPALRLLVLAFNTRKPYFSLLSPRII